jgi:hypothetical protein
MPSGLGDLVDEVFVVKQGDTLSVSSRVDQLVETSSCVVLEYVERRGEVENSTVFCRLFSLQLRWRLGRDTGFVDLDGDLSSSRVSSDGDFASFEGG